MRILMLSRRSSIKTIGGDTFQVRALARELLRLGCDVTVDFSGKFSPENFDLVHLFNIDRPQDIFSCARKAKKRNRPLILTPIFVDYREFDERGRLGFSGKVAGKVGAEWTARAKVFVRALKNGEFHSGSFSVLFSGFFSLQKAVLEKSDFILPNSVSEMKRLCRNFNLDIRSVSWEKIVNGIDPELFNPGEPVEEREGVLCVARVEGIKNQLNLVRAMDGLPWTLTLAGAVAPNHRGYLSRVLKEAGKDVRYLGAVPQRELPDLYRRAKVHVLPSWFETTGLSSLEAAAMGCNIVVTRKGDTEEYFQDRAFYCEPDDVDSIRTAIRQAYDTPGDDGFRKWVLENYTWKMAAAQTLRVYEKVLNGR